MRLCTRLPNWCYLASLGDQIADRNKLQEQFAYAAPRMEINGEEYLPGAALMFQGLGPNGGYWPLTLSLDNALIASQQGRPWTRYSNILGSQQWK